MTVKRSPFLQSQPKLSECLTDLLLALYKHWYDLPVHSTRRNVDRALRELGAALATVDGDLAAAAEPLREFVHALAGLNGVAAVAGDPLAALRDALDDMAAVDGSVREDEIADLLELLRTDDPFGVALGQMKYIQADLPETLNQVHSRLAEGGDRLPAEIRAQVAAIEMVLEPKLAQAENYTESSAAYEEALTALEQIPTVARIAHSNFLQGKIDADVEDVAKRSVPGAGSPFESMGGGGPDKPVESTDFGPLEAVAAESAPAESAPVAAESVEFYPDVRFPQRVKQGEAVPLVFQLTLDQHAESRVQDGVVSVAFEENLARELVEVVLLAPGFVEETKVWSRTITVHRAQNSEPAIFLLTGQELGHYALTLDLRHHGRHIGQVKIDTEVSKQPTQPGTTPRKEQIGAIEELAVPASNPVDLELRISSSGQTLHFMLHSPKAAIGYHWRPVGSITLAAADPQQYLEEKFERMSRLAYEVQEFTPAETLDEVMGELRAVGQGLFEDLFPPALQREYWGRIKPLREAGELSTFLVTSDEPWIPWEMVLPYVYDEFTDEEQVDDFLAESFEFCRWLVGHRPADGLTVQRIEMIIPQLDLAFVEEEKARLEQLASDEAVQIGEPIALRGDALDLIKAGGFEVLHFAAHGQFDPQQPDRSPLALEGGELVPADLNGERVRGLRRSKPLVFLNACHTSRMNFGLIGLGGWAEKLVQDARVSAFIGTLWEVNDKLALAFAVKFYDGLAADQTLGEAFQHARLHVRDLSPANPTWLAYTLYGDPNMRVEF